MLQTAGDLGLEDEPLSVHGIVGALAEDLLERHFAMELLFQCDEDGSQPTASMWAQDVKTLTIRSRRADRVRRGAIGVDISARAGAGLACRW
jgi:hypothetical protein